MITRFFGTGVTMALMLCPASIQSQQAARAAVPEVGRMAPPSVDSGATVRVTMQLPVSVAGHLDSLIVAATNGLKPEKEPEKSGWMDVLMKFLAIPTAILTLVLMVIGIRKDSNTLKAAGSIFALPAIGSIAMGAMTLGIPMALALLALSSALLTIAAFGFLLLSVDKHIMLREDYKRKTKDLERAGSWTGGSR
jgi:hypothetical protein